MSSIINFGRMRPGGSRGQFASVDEGRARLTRTRPLASLNEFGPVTGTLRVNLVWSSESKRRPLLRQGGGLFRTLSAPQAPEPSDGVDLDLACMWELEDGRRGVVQALGRRRGSYTQPPYIYLDVDDRAGATAGENLFVNLDRVNQMRRILFFVYIYDGSPAFDSADATVTMYPSGGPPIEIKLDERANDARTCAVAMLERNGDSVTLRREVRYFRGFQASLDRRYGFGMRWAGWHK